MRGPVVLEVVVTSPISETTFLPVGVGTAETLLPPVIKSVYNSIHIVPSSIKLTILIIRGTIYVSVTTLIAISILVSSRGRAREQMTPVITTRQILEVIFHLL
jgi:hypothetical protein